MSSTKTEEVKSEKIIPEEILGLDEDECSKITLVSNDRAEFVIDKHYAIISKLVAKGVLDEDADTMEIKLPAKVLGYIVEYMNHVKGVEPDENHISKPLKSNSLTESGATPWESKFVEDVDRHRPDLYDLTLAANYMDIPSLLKLGVAKVASLIKGKSLSEVKKILNKDSPDAKEEKSEQKEKITNN